MSVTEYASMGDFLRGKPKPLEETKARWAYEDWIQYWLGVAEGSPVGAQGRLF